MNNAFNAQELSDEQLEMVVGGGHKGNGGHNLTVKVSSTSSNTAKQSQTNTLKNNSYFTATVGGDQYNDQSNATEQTVVIL